MWELILYVQKILDYYKNREMKKLFWQLPALLLMLSCTEQQDTGTAAPAEKETWWKEGVLYQIYPQSFKDSDGDGFGDFQGIIEKLDYIESLGVTMVWMNPFFESPLVDNGYDVSNYRAIHPRYGTMDDFQQMLDGFHERGIRFVLDVVVNHSSNEHEWFRQSRSSRDNPYRDYYHWWPAEKGTPPYRHSLFDPEGAWEYDSLTNAYYLHTFAEEQPDLNWENPTVRREVYDIMRFWAEKGVDGFRMDAFQFASKDTTWPEFPEGHEKEFIKWYGMRPQLHEYLKEMHDEVLEKYDVFAVAEGAGSTFQDAHDLVDADREELQMAYHFESVDMSRTLDRYTLAEFKEVFTRWDSAFAEKGWIAIFLSNHDNARLVNRFGNPDPEFRAPSTQMLNTFLLSMRGTPYTYYGDEIGMTNIDMPTIEEYVDVDALGKYQAAVSAGEDLDEFMKLLNYSSRENGRTPMQWDASPNAGFTTGTPWKRVNKNYIEINVAVQNEDPNSILNHFRKMTHLRKAHPVLVYGDYTLLQKEHPDIYAFTRTMEEEKMLILLNFSEQKASIELPEMEGVQKTVINNYPSAKIEGNRVDLLPYQAVIFKL
jgi:oligo-1,6-glucosidase